MTNFHYLHTGFDYRDYFAYFEDQAIGIDANLPVSVLWAILNGRRQVKRSLRLGKHLADYPAMDTDFVRRIRSYWEDYYVEHKLSLKELYQAVNDGLQGIEQTPPPVPHNRLGKDHHYSSQLLWDFGVNIELGDIVICRGLQEPKYGGEFQLVHVVGEYEFIDGVRTPHRRDARWLDIHLNAQNVSSGFWNYLISVDEIAIKPLPQPHAQELHELLNGANRITTNSTPMPFDPRRGSGFTLEQYLEDFIVNNWAQTEFASQFDLYTGLEGVAGRQIQTDTGPMDLLAISKDQTTFLVIELKRGRASDVVVGQILRYMGYVNDNIAKEGQYVKGAIVALEESLGIRRALEMVPTVDFYRYELDSGGFNLSVDNSRW
jgi:restriction system protein